MSEDSDAWARKLQIANALIHELVAVVEAFIVEQIDYATRNKLGDAEQQHNVKWGRAVIAKAKAQGYQP